MKTFMYALFMSLSLVSVAGAMEKTGDLPAVQQKKVVAPVGEEVVTLPVVLFKPNSDVETNVVRDLEESKRLRAYLCFLRHNIKNHKIVDYGLIASSLVGISMGVKALVGGLGLMLISKLSHTTGQIGVCGVGLCVYFPIWCLVKFHMNVRSFISDLQESEASTGLEWSKRIVSLLINCSKQLNEFGEQIANYKELFNEDNTRFESEGQKILTKFESEGQKILTNLELALSECEAMGLDIPMFESMILNFSTGLMHFKEFLVMRETEKQAVK